MAMMSTASAPARIGRYAGGQAAKPKPRQKPKPKPGKGKPGKPGKPAAAQPHVTVVLGAVPPGLINR
jgi:hypothetical protein